MFAWLHPLEQALLPRRCASCGQVLARGETGWCGPCCFTWVRQTHSPLERFNQPADWTFGHAWLRMKGQEERRLIHAVKYGGRANLGRELGRCMAEECLAAGMPWKGGTGRQDWGLVPIPLHPSRERKRGFNQSRQLALGWADRTGMPVLEWIRRPRSGRSLTRSGRKERRDRTQQVYAWNPPCRAHAGGLDGLILMDDVVTTGSTLEGAHAALRTQWDGPIGFIVALDARR